MTKHSTSIKHRIGLGLAALAMTTLASAAEPDAALADWLGKEITITTSTLGDHVPVGAKLTFVFDSEEDVVRVCARSVPSKRAVWRMDFAVPCMVALNFVRGERYCTEADVKTGNAEVLSSCHRLRSHDVALHPAAEKGSLELHDVIVFPLKPSAGKRNSISILLDSPSRVTHGGHIIGN